MNLISFDRSEYQIFILGKGSDRRLYRKACYDYNASFFTDASSLLKKFNSLKEEELPIVIIAYLGGLGPDLAQELHGRCPIIAVYDLEPDDLEIELMITVFSNAKINHVLSRQDLKVDGSLRKIVDEEIARMELKNIRMKLN